MVVVQAISSGDDADGGSDTTAAPSGGGSSRCGSFPSWKRGRFLRDGLPSSDGWEGPERRWGLGCHP